MAQELRRGGGGSGFLWASALSLPSLQSRGGILDGHTLEGNTNGAPTGCTSNTRTLLVGRNYELMHRNPKAKGDDER